MARILLMEDDPGQAFLLAELLRTDGHEVEIRGTGKEAHAALRAGDFDLLITDMLVKQNNAPVPDGGVSLIGLVRADMTNAPNGARLPIIAISGAYLAGGDSTILKMAEGLGADLCLSKPVDPEELSEAVARLTA